MDNKEQDKINKLGKQLSMDELEQVVGGNMCGTSSSINKAVNSALTELDEEGEDIGGNYQVVWTGSTWQ